MKFDLLIGLSSKKLISVLPKSSNYKEYCNCIEICNLNSHIVLLIYAAAAAAKVVVTQEEGLTYYPLRLLSYHLPAASYAGADQPERSQQREAPK